MAQWKDVLIAVHKLPEDDWMGFTHAYFPAYAFDEYAIQEDVDGHPWAFARQGDGYLALTAAQGVELIREGPSAYRELRSYGGDNVWLCLMGRTASDGSFQDFRRAVLALEVDFRGLAVRLGTLRSDTLSFGWKGLLRVNGHAQPIAGFEHMSSRPASPTPQRWGCPDGNPPCSAFAEVPSLGIAQPHSYSPPGLDRQIRAFCALASREGLRRMQVSNTIVRDGRRTRRTRAYHAKTIEDRAGRRFLLGARQTAGRRVSQRME